MSIKDIIQEQKERSAKFKTEYKKAGVQEPFVFYYDCLLELWSEKMEELHHERNK